MIYTFSLKVRLCRPNFTTGNNSYLMLKKTLISFVLLTMTCSVGNLCYAVEPSIQQDETDETDEKEKRIEINIIEIRKVPRTRSVLNTLSVYLCADSGHLEFSFNQNIGIVEIIVSGPSGTSTVNCDTQDTYYVTVPVGSAPGFYRIDIIGPEYEGTGSFAI